MLKQKYTRYKRHIQQEEINFLISLLAAARRPFIGSEETGFDSIHLFFNYLLSLTCSPFTSQSFFSAHFKVSSSSFFDTRINRLLIRFWWVLSFLLASRLFLSNTYLVLSFPFFFCKCYIFIFIFSPFALSYGI